jgi:hypothetical protein
LTFMRLKVKEGKNYNNEDKESLILSYIE